MRVVDPPGVVDGPGVLQSLLQGGQTRPVLVHCSTRLPQEQAQHGCSTQSLEEQPVVLKQRVVSFPSTGCL